jgi:hypothetical protein
MHRTAPPGHSVGVGATGRSESEGRAADAASAFWPPSAQGTGGRTGGTRRGLGGACQHSPSHSISRWSSPCSAGLARGPPAGVRERPASHTPCMLHACRMHVARCFVFCSRTRMARARSAACDGWAHDGYGRRPRAACLGSGASAMEGKIRVRLARCGGLLHVRCGYLQEPLAHVPPDLPDDFGLRHVPEPPHCRPIYPVPLSPRPTYPEPPHCRPSRPPC